MLNLKNATMITTDAEILDTVAAKVAKYLKVPMPQKEDEAILEDKA